MPESFAPSHHLYKNLKKKKGTQNPRNLLNYKLQFHITKRNQKEQRVCVPYKQW